MTHISIIKVFVRSLLIVILVTSNSLFAQETPKIEVSFSPINPNSKDTVKMISSFPLSGCDRTSYEISQTDSQISIIGLHCGIGEDVCTGVDTLEIGVLNAGNYSVVIEYWGDTYCPGIPFNLWQKLETELKIDVLLSSTHQSLKIYPNPTANAIKIQSLKEIKNIELYSLDGQKLDISLMDSQINMTSLKKGSYMLIIYYSGGEMTTTQVIKK